MYGLRIGARASYHQRLVGMVDKVDITRLISTMKLTPVIGSCVLKLDTTLFVAHTQLYKRPSVGPSVSPSIGLCPWKRVEKWVNQCFRCCLFMCLCLCVCFRWGLCMCPCSRCGLWDVDGVGRPRPPIRHDIVTPSLALFLNQNVFWVPCPSSPTGRRHRTIAAGPVADSCRLLPAAVDFVQRKNPPLLSIWACDHRESETILSQLSIRDIPVWIRHFIWASHVRTEQYNDDNWNDQFMRLNVNDLSLAVTFEVFSNLDLFSCKVFCLFLEGGAMYSTFFLTVKPRNSV